MSGLNQYGVPGWYTGKIPCRCTGKVKGVNCNFRRTLSKYPEEFETWPACDLCGKLIKVDKFRLRGRFDKKIQAKDSGKLCTCDGVPYNHRYGQVFGPYTCNFREDWLFHKAIKNDECPF